MTVAPPLGPQVDDIVVLGEGTRNFCSTFLQFYISFTKNLVGVSNAMAILSLPVFMILVIRCCAIFAESMDMKYKDPSEPLHLQINDLMKFQPGLGSK